MVITMEFKDKLQMIRKERKLSQEEVAENLNISRQAVAKWESGQVYPDIDNLIQLSELFRVTIDSLLKNNTECSFPTTSRADIIYEDVIRFLCDAKRNTYAGRGIQENTPSRMNSHDLRFQIGKYSYLDTYLGGKSFVGEEAVWEDSRPIWAMNYSGRVLAEQFSGDFLKEALLLVPKEYPFRGPNLYKSGDYTYHCAVSGAFDWFQGTEEIYYMDMKVYECYFHGGLIT